MEADVLNCPSCGGPVELANRFVKMVVCNYCGNALAVDNKKLDPTGKTAALVDYPTRFRTGLTCRLRGQKFEILGRVRLEDEDGYWDEWYIQFEDGSVAWLEEEEGELTLSRKQKLTTEVPDFQKARVGTRVTINNQPFFITERCIARIAGAEGQIFYRVHKDQEVKFLDGNIAGKLAAVEYGEDQIEFTVGEVIPMNEIEIAE